MHILLTNDDGLMAPGLQATYAALKDRGYKVTACAPDGQRSASAQSLTLRTAIKVAPWAMPDGSLGFAVYGTPVDCVRLGLTVLAKEPVDIVISGINDDLNLGYDINYSGTVGAAIEGAALGYPSLAVSIERAPIYDWKRAVHVMLGVLDSFSSWNIPRGVAINLNIPTELSTGRNDWFWTKPCLSPFHDYYDSEPQPDGSIMYHVLRGTSQEQVTTDDQNRLDNDVAHAMDGHITLTPVVPNGWHEGTLKRLLATETV